MPALKDLADDLSDDMKRTDSTDASAIGRIIVDAVRYYSSKKWWFNEADGAAFNTASGTEYYALPSPLRVVEHVSVTVSSDPYLLRRRTNAYIEEVYTPSTVYTGKPADWTLFKNQIRIFPIPDASYAVKTQGYGLALPTYSSDTSATWTTDTSTPWANEAYNLIYNRARAQIELKWLYNLEGYQAFALAERDELDNLDFENTRRIAASKIRGWGIE